MNSKVAKYLVDGCMQCKLGATPACKINHWQKELRSIKRYNPRMWTKGRFQMETSMLHFRKKKYCLNPCF
jgi:hypothetical protein